MHSASMELAAVAHLGLGTKLAVLYIYAIASALYAYGIVRPAPRGLPRLALAAPIVLINLLVPLILDQDNEPLLITPIAGIFSLAAFKLLALCLERGPLMLSLTVLQFVGVLLIPVIPDQVFAVSGGSRLEGVSPRTTAQLLHDYSHQMGRALLVSWVLVIPGIPGLVRHWLYTLGACSFLAGVFDMLGAGATAALGIPIAPTFNKPWLSESFAEFWAQRWNLTTTYMMRVLVYEPVMEGRMLAASANPKRTAAADADADADADAAAAAGAKHAQAAAAAPAGDSGAAGTATAAADAAGAAAGSVAPIKAAVAPGAGDGDVSGLRHRGAAAPAAAPTAPAGPPEQQQVVPARRVSKLRRFLALQATFMFSGLWHIAIFWYNTRVFSWRWCAFFTLQAPIVMAENRLKRAWCARRLPPPPRPLRVFTANFLLILIANPLFFGPADDTGFAARNLEASQQLLFRLTDAGSQLLERHNLPVPLLIQRLKSLAPAKLPLAPPPPLGTAAGSELPSAQPRAPAATPVPDAMAAAAAAPVDATSAIQADVGASRSVRQQQQQQQQQQEYQQGAVEDEQEEEEEEACALRDQEEGADPMLAHHMLPSPQSPQSAPPGEVPVPIAVTPAGPAATVAPPVHALDVRDEYQGSAAAAAAPASASALHAAAAA